MSRRYVDRIAVDMQPGAGDCEARGGKAGGCHRVRDATARDPAGGDCDACGSPSGGLHDAPAPQAFVWRRRRYRVRAVLQRWIEVGAWWRTADAVDQEYQLWRVEASPDRTSGSDTGQFDLCRHRDSGRWFLVRTFD